jgi:hemoglobin-like flavoprotein
MPLDVDLLRESFALVAERQPLFTPRFYEILFERYPEARPLFSRNPGPAQQKMLQEALVAVMDHLADAPWLRATLGAMGKKHLDYGVTREMYGWVGASLVATLAEIAADAWTPAHDRAWTDAYATIAGLMLRGAYGDAIPADRPSASSASVSVSADADLD